MKGPQRIVCLSTETCETLYLLGEQARIVGISGFTVRPPQARKEKPKVSGFSSARIDKILAVQPDLVLGYCDLQADIAADLARRGLEVHLFNQRDIAGTYRMIETLGALVHANARAEALIAELQAGLEAIRASAARLPRRPRVYFEEWNEPLISGIGWVSELIELAGGEDCFAELAGCHSARQRIIADPLEVVRRAPELIIGSWCGKRFRPQQVAARPGWQAIPAVRHNQLHEIKSPDILQAGPAALSDGVRQLHALIRACVEAGA
ncbi:cobalamin-binding protein [Pseudomonas sp. MBLB4136]|uniref:cobalamin-binding protein n=1 Tax=Pseudomonas sp. MBLB4136 TaxID=3451558 RepID=UPI003F753620